MCVCKMSVRGQGCGCSPLCLKGGSPGHGGKLSLNAASRDDDPTGGLGTPCPAPGSQLGPAAPYEPAERAARAAAAPLAQVPWFGELVGSQEQQFPLHSRH